METFSTKPGGQQAATNRHAPTASHVVHFFDADEVLIQGAASFLAGGLLRGAPALVLITPARRTAMEQRLGEMGVDIHRAEAAKQLTLLDSTQVVEELLTDGMPDAQKFREVIGAQVAALAEIWRPFQLFGFGDMVDVLYARGDVEAAIELERLWDDLAHRYRFTLYCAYDATRFSHDAHREAFDAICRHHDLIIPVQPGQREAEQVEQQPTP